MRLVGGVVLLPGAGLLAPVPVGMVPPALAIAVIAFAHLEEDGVLLRAGLPVGAAMRSRAARPPRGGP